MESAAILRLIMIVENHTAPIQVLLDDIVLYPRYKQMAK